MDGEDQGMSAITLRGLDHASTLLMINTKRQTFAGTPSHEGEGYIDANVIPEIAIKSIEILKEGATSIYGSDAVAGVVNVLTQKDFEGFLLRSDHQITESHKQNDNKVGFLYGFKNDKNKLVFGLESFYRSPLSARQINGIADLSISTFGKTFITTEKEEISSGPYQGIYEKGEKIPDPNCENNGGILLGGFCKFAYGERFNIINKERHHKAYFNLNTSIEDSYLISNDFNIIYAKVNVLDNPQSPSYPALPFLTRNIFPSEGGSPFKNEIKWRGRPLGSNYPSPFSTKDIYQYHMTDSMKFSFSDNDFLDISITHSAHSNLAIRPDIINSRFLEALASRGGEKKNLSWNLFSDTNEDELVQYVSGNLVAKKKGSLSSIDGIYLTNFNNFDFSAGFQIARDTLDIKYNDLGRIEVDKEGQITKQADLFFLGGGTDVNKSRSKAALFGELNKSISQSLDIRAALRYEDFKNENSLDPKISLRFQPNDIFSLRFSTGTSFTMPSMSQMYGSDIVLGSVRDVNGSVFVRQGQTGNPALKPAKSINSNLGFIFYPREEYSLSFDFFEINYKDRIEAESAQAIVLNNPNSSKITRNASGEIIGVIASYVNEEKSIITGMDFEFNSLFDLYDFGSLNFKITSTTLFSFLTPEHHEHNDDTEDHDHHRDDEKLINRVGKFNYDAHIHSLPKNKINLFLDWEYSEFLVNWTSSIVISGYTNERQLSDYAISLGYTNKVSSFLIHDLSITRPINLKDGSIDLKFGIINLTNEPAPKLFDAPDFSFDTRLHDPTGRTFTFSIQYQL
uniref:Putative TonB-dependent receptor n=1 Tax=uncultured bacterium EIL68H05 TaxID=1768205 RepID=A0A0U2X6T3_9BACT|nr:putative TonB-dependent receptor [uncultured bacterium EIL68H05]